MRRRTTIFRKLMIAFCLLVFVLLLIISLVLASQTKRIVFKDRRTALMLRGEQIALQIQPHLVERGSGSAAGQTAGIRDPAGLQRLLNTFANLFNAELWVSDESGRVIAASANASRWAGHVITDDPAVERALQLRSPVDVNGDSLIRFDPQETMFTAVVPVWSVNPGSPPSSENLEEADSLTERQGIAALHVPKLVMRIPVNDALSTVKRIWLLLMITSLLAFVGTVILAYFLSGQITKPLKQIQGVAERIAKGEYRERVKTDLSLPEEIRHLVQAFNHAADEIEHTIEKKKAFEELRRELFASVSHEFRAPLSSLQGFLELMIDGKIPQDQQVKYLQIMHEDTELLTRLVKDLLDLSRIEAGQVRLELHTTDVEELVRQSLKRVEASAAQKGIELGYQMKQGRIFLEMDRQRMQQVLNNLLENSIRHTGPGGRIDVLVSKARSSLPSEEIVFEITDTGQGIPPGELPHVWERFYKVDKARTRTLGGTGLGLSIVKQLVELHGGSVEAESQVGQGTTMRFKLPGLAAESGTEEQL